MQVQLEMSIFGSVDIHLSARKPDTNRSIHAVISPVALSKESDQIVWRTQPVL